jgi:hypothetical protein
VHKLTEAVQQLVSKFFWLNSGLDGSSSQQQSAAAAAALVAAGE